MTVECAERHRGCLVRLFTFACPLCAADRQCFSILSALARRPKKLCRGCGIVLRSQPPIGVYLLFLLYTQFIALIAAFPLIWAYMEQQWMAMAALWVAALLLCHVPAMAMHARGTICRDKVDPDRSYVRAKKQASTHDP
jgi:hypothetical protein